MKSIKFILLLTIISAFQLTKLQAEVKLPKIFSSNMVLQQGMEIPVWGWADKGERVSITFNGKTVRTKAGKDGKWKVKLPVQQYGGPFTMTVEGKNTLVFENVLIGDVWVCSGQSNMEMQVVQSNDAEKEIAAANYPKIRLFTVPKAVAQFPKEDIKNGEWVECSPETVAQFSAVGYFFGRKLQEELNIPIGLLHTSWGGTVVETWSSAETIDNDPDFKALLAELRQMNMDNHQKAKMEKMKKIFGGEIPNFQVETVNGIPAWAANNFDDSGWKTLEVPKYWEEQGLIDVDGTAWYRKDFNLTESQTKTNGTLHLAKVDDSDVTYINGVEIGETKGLYNKDRIYTIDKNLLKAGKNTITVRVEDTGGNGGIWGNADELYLASSDGKVNLDGNWKFKISKAKVGNMNIGPNSYPTLLFNAMLNPVIPYGIKGAIWYQGESNANRAKQYQRVFPEMITDWRNHWTQGDFPFYFVSLANFNPPTEQPGESTWAELREAQTKTLNLPNTGMAVTIDIGEADDIHPKNKQDVGLRLALNALKLTYDKNIVHSGPQYKSVEFKDGKAYITFSETGSGLMVKDRYGYVNGFSVAGSDKKFHWAKAEIIDNNRVVVYSDEVKNPISVRYAWANNPGDVNLYNHEGLPANPFRTDEWPGITK